MHTAEIDLTVSCTPSNISTKENKGSKNTFSSLLGAQMDGFESRKNRGKKSRDTLPFNNIADAKSKHITAALHLPVG